MRRLLLASVALLLVAATRPVGAQVAAQSLETGDGAVLIYGDAANATVFIDGKRRGQMPVSAATGFRAELPAGQHTIELRREANNRFYGFSARLTVNVKEEALVPVTMPALAPGPLPDAAARVEAVVDAFLAGMAAIPAGSFMMGGRDEEDSADTEFPRHGVVFRYPFLMQKQNVTFEQWDACIADDGCTYVPDDEGRGRGDRQVFNVSWEDARAFARWLSRRLDRDCRLPSEAEWEYAVRGGTQTTFFFGEDESLLHDYVGTGGGHPTAVQPRLPNPYGVFGMVGGVSQWVADCWQTTYRGAPANGSTWEEGDCKSRDVRGGFWDGGPWYLRSARRSAMTPRNRYNYVGLRLVCAIP